MESPSEDSDKRLRDQTKLWCFDITPFSRSVQVVLLSLGVFLTYGGYSTVQEYIFLQPGYTFGVFMTFTQALLFSVFGALERYSRNQPILERKAPLKDLALIGVLHLLTAGLSNSSLVYLNYPTQVFFKSSKVIPVMIMRMVLLGKRYGRGDYISVLLLVAGLCTFSLADAKTTPNWNPTGVILICLALVADAFIGNVQERTMKLYQSSQSELVLWTNMVSGACALVMALYTGELWTAVQYCNTHIYSMLTLLAILGFFGTSVVLTLVKDFGSVVAVTVTSTRKMFTVVLSYIIFPKPFTPNHLMGGLLIFSSLTLSSYLGDQKAFQEKWHQLVAVLRRTLRLSNASSLSSSSSDQQKESV